MIRQANDKDKNWLVREIARFYATLPKGLTPWPDEEDEAKIADQMITRDVTLVADHDGLKAGFIYAIRSPQVLSPKSLVLAEQILWVSPEFRGKGICDELIEGLYQVGKAMEDIDLVTIVIDPTSKLKYNYMAKRDFIPVGVQYARKVN